MSSSLSLKARYAMRATSNLERFVAEAQGHKNVSRVDVNTNKCVLRVIHVSGFSRSDLVRIAEKYDISLSPVENKKNLCLAIDGMTCTSCELLIEKKFKAVPGVQSVTVNAHKGTAFVECVCDTEPTARQFQDALGTEKYRITSLTEKTRNEVQRGLSSSMARPSTARVVGFFVLAGIVGIVLSRMGVFQASAAIGDNMTLGAAFIVGLIASTSSCLATVGGLLLSSLAEANKGRSESSFLNRAFPTGMFIAGRLVSYILFGALIGVIGKALSPSPLVTGGLVLLAAAYMIVMGLDMLGIAPQWLKRMLPRMPKALARRMLSTGEGSHLLAPALTGAATFFVPCGFTQSLQLYALTLGDPMQSAALLGVFALGTTPALSALGLSFNAVKGKVKEFVFHFAGALIVLMGVANIQNGFTITGYPLTFDWLKVSTAAPIAALVPLEGASQVMRMNVVPGGYAPNQFTVRAGVPTKWVINGSSAGGCAMALSAPQLGIRKLLNLGENVIEFTAPTPGTYSFSCSMGMYRGLITAIPAA